VEKEKEINLCLGMAFMSLYEWFSKVGVVL
jgi:hypothetical protein